MGRRRWRARRRRGAAACRATRARDTRSAPGWRALACTGFHPRAAARRRPAAPARRSARACSTRHARTGADLVVGERQFSRDAMPASRYYANASAAGRCRGSSASRSATRSAASASFAAERAAAAAAARPGYDIETEMLVKVRRRGGAHRHACRSRRSTRRSEQAAAGARHDADLLPRGLLPLHRATLTCAPAPPPAA